MGTRSSVIAANVWVQHKPHQPTPPIRSVSFELHLISALAPHHTLPPRSLWRSLLISRSRLLIAVSFHRINLASLILVLLVFN